MSTTITPVICLNDLATIGKAEYHVPLREFPDRPDALARICQQLRENSVTPEELKGVDLSEVRVLECGVVLRIDGDEKVTPNCCSDLGGLQSLRDCLDSTDGSWTQIWIGHPWISARRVGEMIEVSHPHEESEPQRAFAMSVSELRVAVDQAYVEVRAFLQWMQKSLAAVLSVEACKQAMESMLGMSLD